MAAISKVLRQTREASQRSADTVSKSVQSSESSPPPASGRLFHQKWWLDVTTAGECRCVTILSGEHVAGCLPFIVTHRSGFTSLRMPPFTHVLGPEINPGGGKPQTQLARRLSVTRSLIEQLPRFDYFKTALPSVCAEGLAFQDRGFQVTTQYTFEIDCRRCLKELWNGMHFKTRQHIRRAEEKYLVESNVASERFVAFYLRNLGQRGFQNSLPFDTFPRLVAECRRRESGDILAATRPDGTPVAMVFVVWGHGVMYYLLSSRSADVDDNGSVNLLIWSAVRNAHSRGLVFDLDGVTTSGTARFLSGFGGQIKARLIVQKSRPLYAACQFARRRIFRRPNDRTSDFT
jgi:hypothetical protein